MKKILSIIIVTMVSTIIWAQNDVITYTAESKLNDATSQYSSGLHTKAFNVSIMSHTFNNGTGTITFSGDVTDVGSYAFYGCISLTSITIPDSVTSIGSSAFNSCTGLTSITIPNSVTNIGENAFFYCTSLTSITIPNSVTSIERQTFIGCTSLTSITIPNSVTSIGNGAFNNCTGLTSIIIPYSVTSIGNYAFSGCTGLTSVSIPKSVTSIGGLAFYHCTGIASITIPNSVTSIGDKAFELVNNIVYYGTATGSPWGAKNLNGYVEGYLMYKDTTKKELLGCSSAATDEIIIPNSVIRIGESAFRNCSSLTSVTLGNSVMNIGNYAFSGCTGLTSITIPNSVTSIGDSAFNDCTGLTSVTIGNSVTSIGISAFRNCSGLTSITIPNSVTSIGNYAFFNCESLTSITIPNSVTSIENGVFRNCTSFTSVTIPNSVTSIGSSAFRGCSGLTSITIPNSVKSIGIYAFYECTGLTSVTIGNSVTSIGSSAFSGCIGLTSITIPNSVTSIESEAFSGCSGLTSITIGNSVTSIGQETFSGCSGLTSITIPNSVTGIGVEAFKSCSGITSVTWNAKNCNDYNFGNQVEKFMFGDSVEVIPSSICSGMSKLTAITIPSSVTSIGNDAFYHCSGLAAITIPNSVTSIGGHAFSGCKRFTSITIPQSVKNIGEYAFLGCDDLTSIQWNAKNCNGYNFGCQVEKFVFGDSVQVIPSNICFDMSILTSITIPNSVTRIGDNAFKYVNNIVYHGTATGSPWGAKCLNGYVEDYMVYKDTTKKELLGCSSATTCKIAIPNSVTRIGGDAFYKCYGIQSIRCEAVYPPSCGYYSFQYVKKKIPLYIPHISVELYSAANGWKDFSNIQTFFVPNGFCGDSLTYAYKDTKLIIFGIGLMYDYPKEHSPWHYLHDSIETITINHGATSIGQYAFYGLKNEQFKTINLPNSIEIIGSNAFEDCAYLKTVSIGSNVEEIKSQAFANDERLLYITSYAVEPPLLSDNAFANFDAYLKVPCEAKDEYVVMNGWKKFNKNNISCIGAEQADPTTTVITQSGDNSVVLTWPTTTGAATYTIAIYTGGTLVCTLTFKSDGTLIEREFANNAQSAPMRDNARMANEAMLVNNGMKFEITGLDYGTSYTYTVLSKDQSGTKLTDYSGSFATNGYTAVDNIFTEQPSATKVLRNGHLYLLRDGKTYTIQGAEVKAPL